MERKKVLHVAGSLAAFAVCVFVGVSLLTYSPDDLAEYHLPAPRTTHNACGLVGAHLAGFLIEGFGVCAWLLPLYGVAWGILNLLGRGTEQLVVRAAGAALLLASTSAFAHTVPGAPETMPGYGGVVGVALGTLLTTYFGTTGQWLLGFAVAAMALLMLSVDELLAPPVAWVARKVARGLAPRRKKRPRAKAKPQTAETQTSTRPAQEPATATATESPTEDLETESEPFDTGRPVTVGYLDHVSQDIGSVGADTEAPTEDSDVEDIPEPSREAETYILPPPSLLDEPRRVDHSQRQRHIEEQIEILERTLKEFGVGARVVHIDHGPVVTRYELALEAGTKLTKVTSLSDDLAIACKAPAVRIVAPIPGKSTVGVELPNPAKELVRMRDLIESEEFRRRDYTIPLFVGKDASGKPIIGDLTRMPHLLLAGATGSGKSVCINSIICSILMTQHPDDVRLILIDPKMVELSAYEEIPHLLTPVVTDIKRAAWILDWATRQMDERYDILASVGVRSIAAYNRLGEDEIRARLGEDVDYDRVPFRLPYIVIIIDELADLMMMSSKNIEASITRLAQKSRAVGLHAVLATQRPSVDVITGLIKSNLPTRISFKVTSKVDSRTILDRNGAEKLLGSGDMLFLAPGTSSLIRAQGTYLSDEEIARIVDFVKRQRKPKYSLNLDGAAVADDETAEELAGYSQDDLYEQACRIVLSTRRGSVSLLQRKLEIGYTRAARLIDMMAAEGIVGDYKGSKAREVIMSLEEWEQRRSGRRPVPQTADEVYRRLDAVAENDTAND